MPGRIPASSTTMSDIPVFRLYILGKLNENDPAPQTLTILAEHGIARRLHRAVLKPDQFVTLLSQIRALRAYMVSYGVFDESALKALGGGLFDLIIDGPVCKLLEAAVVGHDRLPLELVVEDPAIAGWPWEYLYDTNPDENKQGYLCQEYCPISRSIFNSRSINLLPRGRGRIRILFVLATSQSDRGADAAEELARHREVFEAAPVNRKEIEFTPIAASGPEDVIKALAGVEDFDILHYFGHATFDPEKREGYLAFPSEQKWYANSLAKCLLDRKIRLVFLNACETGVGSPHVDPPRSALATAILDRGVPAVIATQFEIPDAGAHRCSAMIYKSLAGGRRLFQAMREGRMVLELIKGAKHPDWGIPVLYTNHPNLVVFPPESSTSPTGKTEPGRDP